MSGLFKEGHDSLTSLASRPSWATSPFHDITREHTLRCGVQKIYTHVLTQVSLSRTQMYTHVLRKYHHVSLFRGNNLLMPHSRLFRTQIYTNITLKFFYFVLRTQIFIQTGSGALEAFYQYGTCSLSLETQRPVHGADHWFPSSAGVHMALYTSTPQHPPQRDPSTQGQPILIPKFIISKADRQCHTYNPPIHNPSSRHWSPWRWKHYRPLKRWQTHTSLHGATTQKTAIFILAAVRTSNPT
jgi:hypothetical protein